MGAVLVSLFELTTKRALAWGSGGGSEGREAATLDFAGLSAEAPREKQPLPHHVPHPIRHWHAVLSALSLPCRGSPSPVSDAGAAEQERERKRDQNLR